MACRYRFNKTLKQEGRGDLIALRKKAIKFKKTKPVVLLADRVNMAGDNAEALFRYLMENGYDEYYDINFVVHKDSDDYERMKAYGHVVAYGSEEYKLKFLAADKIITAGFDRWFINFFGKDIKYLGDLYKFDFYLLQHGVTMNDWSSVLNVAKKGIHRFYTVTDKEREYLLKEQYGYTEEEVPLTGFARYDLLEDEAEKLIVFAPTWRIHLAGEIDEEHGSRFYSDKIKGSDYHTFYNGLINNERLLEAMRENGYRGEFYLHPSFIGNEIDFDGNDVIKVLNKANYNRIFRKASILITDYSSVSIDFAYLNKPIVYSQYDKDTFFDDHACERGYFDYDRDGFGAVCRTIDETVDEIIGILRRGCTMAPEYTERVDAFFHYRDKNNRKRIADNIFGKLNERS